MAQTNRKSATKKDKSSFTSGVVHIQSTFNKIKYNNWLAIKAHVLLDKKT